MKTHQRQTQILGQRSKDQQALGQLQKGQLSGSTETASATVPRGQAASLASMCSVLLAMKRRHHVKDIIFRELLALMQIILPPDSLLPPSWYVMKRIIG